MSKIYLLSVILLTCLHSIAQQDITLTKSLSEVVVTGQFKPQSLKNSVYQVRVLNQEKIRLSGATNIHY